MADTIDLNKRAAESHDPMCPRADIDEAWNGAECACGLIRILRSVKGVEHYRTDYDAIWREVEAEISEHDAFCPPGLKSAPPDRCASCAMIRSGRQDERLRILRALYRLPAGDSAPWVHVDDVLRVVGSDG